MSCCLSLAQQAQSTQQQIAEHNQKLRQYLEAKKPDQAISELKALATLEPENAEIHGNLGVLLFFKGDCAAAAPQLRTAATARAELWRIRFLLGVCERRLGDAISARTEFEAAFPHLEDKKTRFEAGMELIGIYTDAGDVAKAAPIVEALRADDPTNARVLFAAYRIYAQLTAEVTLSLSMADPESAEMHDVLARETLRYGSSVGAIEQYRAAIKIDPKLPGVHFELAEALHYSLNPADKAEAESEYKLALAQNPGDVKAECRLGEIDVAKNNLAQAQAEYAQAHKLAPTDIDANLGLARTLIQLNQQEQARPFLEEVLKQEPANETAHYLLSRLLWQEGKKEDAKREEELFKKYKAMKEKMRAVYKQLQVAPPASSSDEFKDNGDANGR
jgi:tetratricopeptide (TPR) repeat protein